MKGLAARKVYCVLVILLGILSLITCGKDDWITGLGSHVDTSPPVIQVITDHGTGPGSFLTGTKRIYIDASDDIGVNSVTVIYSYNYVKDGVLYPMEVAVEAFWNEEDGCYTLDIDTRNGFFDESTQTWLPMADGPLAAIVIVEDTSGKKTTTPDIIYTVKNGPPKINIQIPRPKISDTELLNNFIDPKAFPTVVSDSYFLGVFEDLAGVAPGYPLIKFWDASLPEPVNYKQNAGWENVGNYNSPGDGWIRPDEGVAEDSRGEKGGSFRYYLRKRQADGTPFAEGTKNGLAPDKKYNLKIKAVDINGITLEWPHDAYSNKPSFMTMFLDAEGIPPVITVIEPEASKLYFRDNFNIIAEAVHQGDLSTDIFEMRFEVIGKDRQKVLLKKWTDTEITDYAQKKFEIELEKTYYCKEIDKILQPAIMIDKESDVPANASSQVTFTDGNFTFEITAYDDIGARKTVSFSLYVDKQPPVTTVTSVSPYYTQDPISDADKSNGFENINKPYRRWTVNKTVKIAVNSTDNRGDAIDLATNYTKFKYLLLKENDIQGSVYYAWKGSDPDKTFEQFLFEASGAKFLDAVRANSVPTAAGKGNSNMVEFVEGKDGSYTLWLQTHKFDAAIKYNLWMYIVAMDNAGNISFDKILLNVDQDTDNPKIDYTEFSTFMNDKSFIRFTVEDDNGLSDIVRTDNPKVEYRFAKNDSEWNTLKAKPEDGWYQVYDWQNKSWDNILSEDVKRVTINDLTLRRIANDLGLKEGEDLKTKLGTEAESKYIQIRAIDNEKTKVYLTDGTAEAATEWRKFTMDLTIPEIRISEKDLDSANITRDKDNPFGIPERNRAYKNLTHFYGDIIEENLSSISVKIDGKNDQIITYTILDKYEDEKDKTKFSVIYDGKPAIAPSNFYVWKNNDNSKRWYIPRADFDGLDDGPHTFEITFEDKVPQTYTMSFTFYKDTKGPAVSFVTPGGADTLTFVESTKLNENLENGVSLTYTTSSGYTAKSIYDRLAGKSIKDMSGTLSGTFTDDYSPIAGADGKYSFSWKIDDGGWQDENLITEETDSKSINWEVPLKKSKGGPELDDGVHILSIRVNDSLGNGSEKNNIAFLIDKSIPELTITDAPKKAINGAYTFKGTITKTINVKKLTVKLGNDEIIAIDKENNDEVTKNKYGVSISVDPTPNTGKTFDFTVTVNPAAGGLDDGPKSLMFSAVGSSGQSGMTTSSFTLDTKGPSISIGAPLNDSVYLTNTEWGTLYNAVKEDNFSSASSVDSIYDKVFAARIKDGSPSFTVTFTDEASDVFVSGKDKYWYKFDDDTEWTTGTINSADFGKTSVSISLPLPKDKQTDGVHRVSIRATDSLGNGYDNSNANTAPEKESGVGYQSNLVFMIDTGIPVIVIKNSKGETVPSADAADFGVHKTPFTITGTITGTFEVQDLNVKIGSAVIVSKGDISITRPNSYSKKTFNFTGVTIDPSKAAKMDGSEDGSYTVSVTVKGSSEQSTMNVSTFTLDTQGPKISVNSPIKEKIYIDNTQLTDINNAISNNNFSVLSSVDKKNYYDLLKYNVKDASAGLSGSFADTYSSVNTQFWYKFDNETSWTTGTAVPNANPMTAEWQIKFPPTMEDGLHRVSIRVKDALDNGYDNTTASTNAISALAGDKKNSDSGHETNLSFILDTKAPALAANGIEAGEVIGPTSQGYFTVSGEITGTYLVKRLSASILLPAATVIETADNGVIQNPVIGDTKISDLILSPVSGKEKTYYYSFKVNTSGLSYGSLTVTVNAVGSSDQSDLKTLPFIFDNKGPSISVSVPGNKVVLSETEKGDYTTAMNNGTLTLSQQTNIKNILITDKSLKLSGTISDEYSPISGSFWWSIDGGEWQEEAITVSGSKSVGWEVPLTAVKDGAPLDDGVHLLSIRATDKWGNGSDGAAAGADGFETNIAFMIDTSIPVLAITEEPVKALKGEFTIKGTVTNTYGVKQLNVKLGNSDIAVKLDGVIGQFPTVNGITFGKGINVSTVANDGRSFTFTATIDPVPYDEKTPNGLKDGPTSLTFNAIGSSGQAAMITSSFTLDTTGPSIAVGAPISSSIYITDGDWNILEPAVTGDNFASVTGNLNTLYNSLFAARINDSSASLTVNFTDAASSVFDDNNKTFWYRYDGNTSWTPVTITDAKQLNEKSVSVKLPPPGGKWTDSVHRVSIRVKDSLGNGYNDLSANVPATESGAGYHSNLIFMIDSGIPVVNFNTEKATFIPSQKLNISGSITNTFKVQELNAKIGSYTATIDPTLLITPANKKRTYEFTNISITPSDIKQAIGDNEGSYTISLTAKGSSEFSDTKISSFILDTKGPEISVNSPIREKIYTTAGQRSAIDNAITTNVITSMGTGDIAKYYDLIKYNIKDVSSELSGSFTDTYSAIGNTFWYKFDSNSWIPVDIINPDGKKSIDWKIPLTGLGEGLHNLSIRVLDEHGNGFNNGGITPEAGGGNGYESDITFLIDTVSPKFEDVKDLDVIGPSTGTFTVTGRITDTHLVKRMSISLGNYSTVLQANDNGIYTTPSGMTTDPHINSFTIKRVDTVSKTFEYSFNVNAKNGINELPYGSRSITMSAVGSSEQSNVKILPFIYDNEGPKITVNMPIKEKVYISDADWNILKSGGDLTDPVASANLSKLSSIRDATNGLNGYFNDDFSNVNGTFWYQFPDDAPPNNGWIQGTTSGADKSVAWNIPLTNPLSPTQLRGDDIYRVNIRVMDEKGNGYNNSSTLPDGGGPGYETNLAFKIDMGIPEFTKFELQRTDGTPFPDTNIFLNGAFIVAGTIERVISVEKLTVKIGDNDITSGSTINWTSTNSELKKHEFTILVPKTVLDGLGQKSFTLSVTALGSSDQSSMALKNFTYDTIAPDVTFNQPSTGTHILSGNLSNNGKYDIVWSSAWVTGSVKVGGVANDGSGIDKIYYHLGKLSNHHEDGANDAAREANYNSADWIDTRLDQEDKALNWSGGVYYWNYTNNLNGYQFDYGIIEEDVEPDVITTGVSQFYLPMYVKVVDRAGNIRVVQYKLFIDPDKDIPTATITYPDDNAYVGGAIRITGGANDNDWVHSVEIRVIDTTDGSYYFNRDESGNITDTVLDMSQGWVRATFQGNVDQKADWYHSINADGRLNPASGKTRPVRVEVRAVDTKDPLHQIPDRKGSVVSRAFTFMSEVPRIETPVISKTGIKDRTYTDSIKVSGQFKVTTDVKDVGGLSSIKVRQTGMSGFTEIVKDGKFTNATPLTGQDWTVTPPTKVLQGSWKPGYRYYILEKGSITNWQAIDNAWFDGKKYDVDGVMIQYKGGANGSGAEAYEASGTANDWDNQYFVYKLEFSVDSTVLPSLGYGRTGLYNLELQAYNNNQVPGPYNTNGTYTLGIDNFYPSAEITTQYNATTSKFYVMGTAKDYDNQSGSQMGIARVLVYFERNGTYFNARAIATGAADTFYDGKGYTDDTNKNWSAGVSRVSYPNVRDMTKSTTEYGWNTASFANFPYLKSITKGSGANAVEVWESPHAMVIDGMEIGESVDSDGDGTYAEQLEGKGDVTWQALFDTTKFGDGPITVHYIIMDQAGNATHYSDDIYIGNNRPLIRSINLGTDVNADGSVTAWTSSTSPGEYLKNAITVGDTAEGNSVIPTDFIVRNSRLAMRLEALYGNGQKNYRISYVSRDAAEVQSTAMVRGNVYTIKDEGNTEWTKYGAFNNNPGTTFVASGPARAKNSKGDDTSGTVYSYQYYYVTESGTQLTGNFGGNDWVVTTPFNAFSATSAMKDSTGKEYDDITNKMTLKRDKFFIVKVYDTTVTGGAEAQQLARVALINMDFDNQDTRKPKAVITPFHWISKDDNSLYLNSKDNGHIELEAQTNGLPKVSGQISVRGTVTDNNIIGTLWARMEGLNFTTTTTDTIGGSTYYRIANFDTATGKLVGVTNQWANGWSCSIEDPGVNQDGHSVSFKLDIDTNKLTSVVGSDVVLRIVARDYGNNNVAGTYNTQDVPTLSTAASALTSQYNMDIVPYISGIETRLHSAYSPMPSAFSRSAQGWYPVHEDEVITIRGFNFRSGNTTVTVNGTALNGVTVTGTTSISARVDNDGTDNNVNTITSGPLVVRVNNAIDSINNTRVSTADYNKEGNGINNDILNDNRYLYVWNTGYIDNTDVTTVFSPFMRMDANANRLLSHGHYPSSGNGRLRVNKNGTQYLAASSSQNRLTNTTVSTGGTNNSWYAAGSDITAGNYPFKFGFSTPAGANVTTGTTFNPNSINIVAAIGSNNNRFKIPRIAVQPTNGAADRTNARGDRVFMSYYDGTNNELRVLYGNTGDGSNISNISENTTILVANDTTTKYKGSMYTAAGLLSNGLPVLAWYDRVSQNLIFSHGGNTGAAPLNGTNLNTTYNGGTAQNATNLSVTATSQEYVYTAAGHGLTESSGTANATNATRVLVNSTTVSNRLRYVRRIRGDVFVLNTDLTAATNVGADYGDPIYVTKPIAVTAYGGSATARTYTVAAGHGLANNDEVYYVYNVGDTTTTASQGYIRNLTTNTFAIYSAATGGTQFNSGGTTANSMYIYPVKYRISAVRSQERYYSPNTNLTVGQTVTVGGNPYNVAEIFASGTNNFKLADVTTGAIVNTLNPTFTLTIPATAAASRVTIDTGTGASPALNTWQGNAVVIDTFKGTHVDMAVDGANNVHLAYYDVANGGLYYVLIPATGAGANVKPDTSNIRPVKVDTYLSAGTKIMINVRQEGARYVPYISYAHGSFNETKNSIRVAWRTDFSSGTVPAGTNEKDSFTGAWEVMTIPVTATVIPNTDEFVCNGVPTATTGWATQATGADQLKGYWNGTTNLINKSILVGYMTDKWYEGAVLKRELY